MKKLILLTILILALVLSGCNKTAAQIQAEGTRYATIKAADQSAFDAESARAIREEQAALAQRQAEFDESSRQAMRNEWYPFWVVLGQYTIVLLFILVTTTAGAASRASWVAINALGDGAARYIQIRSGLIPLDPKTRLPRQFIYEIPEPQQVKGLLNFTFSKTRRKWTVVDPVSHRVLAKLDVDHVGELGMAGMELNRQAVLEFIVMSNMRNSGLLSDDGSVADAMGDSAPIIPGQALDSSFVSDVTNVMKSVIKDMTDE